MPRVLVASLVVTTLAAAGCGRDGSPDAAIRNALKTDRPPAYARNDKDGRRVWTETQAFYRDRAYSPVWVRWNRRTAAMKALVSAIRTIDREGLDPALYDVSFLERHQESRKGFLVKTYLPDVAAEIDVRLTVLYLQLASDLADGISDLAHSDPSWHIQAETFDAPAHLSRALAERRIAESLEALKPTNPEYRALRNLLAEYRAQSTDAQRIRQIALNMERWRWLPRVRGPQHIVVNIPAFRLDAWQDDRVALSMRVVVGKRDTRTPIFNDAMTHIVFSPYWNVPKTIAAQETLPSMMRDPTFLARTRMEVLDEDGDVVHPSSIDPSRPEAYRFRQRPGAQNSLGLIKFMFPNEFNVYLHDTPADSLFARTTRSFSHGCVRVEHPEALAEYALKDQPEWTSEKIAKAMHAGEERTVKLRRPIPVYIGYWTVDVAPDGRVDFKPDVYGLDARQSSMLAQRVPALHSSNRLASSAR